MAILVSFFSSGYCQNQDLERSCYAAEDTVYLDFFPTSETYRLNATYTSTNAKEELIIPTYSGIEKSFVRVGKISFSFEENIYELSAFQQPDQLRHPVNKYMLFIPFKDATTGEDTYGGGRYLDISLASIPPGGKFIIDFNKAYNPLCAYADGFNCPIPPVENYLEIPILAGEKQYTKSIE